MYLTQYLPWTTFYEGWERLGAEFVKLARKAVSKQRANMVSSDPSKVVIHKDQRRRQLQYLWQLELAYKLMERQALVATSQIMETTGRIGSRLT